MRFIIHQNSLQLQLYSTGCERRQSMVHSHRQAGTGQPHLRPASVLCGGQLSPTQHPLRSVICHPGRAIQWALWNVSYTRCSARYYGKKLDVQEWFWILEWWEFNVYLIVSSHMSNMIKFFNSGPGRASCQHYTSVPVLLRWKVSRTPDIYHHTTLRSIWWLTLQYWFTRSWAEAVHTSRH